MVMTDNSDILLQRRVQSSVQSTIPLSSLDRQSSILSLLDVFQHTCSGDTGSSGSMNIEELLNNFVTEEEIAAYEQTLLPNPDFTLSAAPMGAATVPTAAAIARNNPQEQGHGSTANFQEVDSAQFQEINEEMNLEDFLIMAGVVRTHGRSPPLQQSFVSSQNNYNTTLGSGTPGCMVRPVIASGGGGNVPSYQSVLEGSVKDAASAAVARKPGGYQLPEDGYGGKMWNNSGEGGFRQGSPVSPVSSDSVNNLDMDVNLADGSSGLAAKVVSRKQHRRIKNRESAARSRARRQAYTRDLEAQLHKLREENARLQQDMEELRRIKQQDMEEVMKARKGKDGKKGLKRSWSSLY